MTAIDRALRTNPFRIDQFRCREAAQALKAFEAKPVDTPWAHLSVERRFSFKALFVSVCHQFNWDQLQAALAEWLTADDRDPIEVALLVRPSDIERLLSVFDRPDRIRPVQRAHMLRTTAQHLFEYRRSGELDRMIARRTLEGPGGYYETMQTIPAFYEDALRKKMRVLAHDIYRESIIDFVDPENLRPAVEYHLIRLYLRTGRVYPTDQAVVELLTGSDTRARARLVRLLREVVQDAMNLTSFYSGLDAATLNYVEWQLGRSVCLHDEPRCLLGGLKKIEEDVAILATPHCPNIFFCRSFNDENYGWFKEPQFQKAIY